MPTHSRSRRIRRHTPAALVVSCLLSATAACGGATDNSSADTRTLSLSILAAPKSFEVTQLSDGQPAYIWNSVYDTLLYTDDKGQLQPNAAESWAYTDAGRTLTLKLRRGMAFSNGHAVDSAAVKASLDYVRSTPGGQQPHVASIDAVEAPDDVTVVLRLKHPDAALLPALSMGAGAIADPGMKDASAALNPIGSGPYLLDTAEKMVTQFLRGVGQPTQQIFNPKSHAYDPALNTTYPFDPAAAKKLIADAGYPNGFSVAMPSLAYTKPFEPTIGQALKDIGINVTWEPVPAPDNALALSSGKYAMYFSVDGLNGTAREAGRSLAAASEQDPAEAAEAFKKVNAYGVKNAWNAPVSCVGTSWVTKKGSITYLGDGSSTLVTIRALGVAN